jgi:pimeloyl-ACP methyl ester carboxylesterase
MASVTEHRIDTGGVELHVLDAGTGPAVVLSHGFPELSYSWRHQIGPLADAGYRVIVPDQRGYGRSSRPEAIEDYDIEQLAGDLLGILDALGESTATVVGHDWGSLVVWHLALAQPDRVTGVCGMSVPFSPRPPVSPIEIFRHRFADSFFYILYFQEPGVADEELGRDPATTMRRLLAGLDVRTSGSDARAMASADDGRGFVERLPEPERLPDWLDQEELDHYVAEFRRTGFTGGINWYRNFTRNWERTEHLAGARIRVPSFFIGGSADPVLVMSPPDRQDQWLDDHRGTVLIDGAGHWVQQERPDATNAALLDFLAQIHP